MSRGERLVSDLVNGLRNKKTNRSPRDIYYKIKSIYSPIKECSIGIAVNK